MPARTAAVFTHRRPRDTVDALAALRAAAAEVGCVLRFDPEETRKHGLEPGPGVELDAPTSSEVDLCIVLGGDGTILHALRSYARTGVPVFSVNFGEVGFLATLDRDGLDGGLASALRGNFEVLELPAIELAGPDRSWLAINDVSIHRQAGLRVAKLAYSVGEEEIGRVRCDGLVVATPAGSTGYNLANGGPVLAWGVEGYAVSFIAPHSLTARALVVAPDDVLTIENRSREEPADVTVDGRPVCELAPGERFRIHFRPAVGHLAQVRGATFYHRLREKFGRLAD